MKITPTFLTLLVLFLPHAYPQEHTRPTLPKGSIARLGEGKIHKVVYSRDGSRLAVVASNRIWLYDTETYQEVAELTGHTGLVSSVAFSYAERTLVSASWDGTVRLWDADTGEFKRTIAEYPVPVKDVVFASVGFTLAIVVRDRVEVWISIPWSRQATLTGHTDEILCLAFGSRDTVIATGSADKTVRLWNGKTGELTRTLTRHTEEVTGVAFSRNGRTLASGSADGTVRLWYVPTGEHMRMLDWSYTPVISLTFRRDGKVLATGRGSVQMWNPVTGEYEGALPEGVRRVASIAFSPNKKVIASGGGWQKNTVRLWDAETGEMMRILTGHVGEVKHIAFSPDGTELVSICEDGTAFVWETTD